ncbi:MAG: hypothetical protein WCJ55_10075 [Chloroflexales bacterium]
MSMLAPTVGGASTATVGDLTDEDIADLMAYPKVAKLVQIAMDEGAAAADKVLTPQFAAALDQIAQLKGQLKASGKGSPDLKLYTDQIASLNAEIKELNEDIAALRKLHRGVGGKGVATKGEKVVRPDTDLPGMLGDGWKWATGVFTRPRRIIELFVLLGVIAAMVRIWVIGGNFSLNGLASLGIIPKDWSSAPSLDLFILGKVTGFHLYQVAISLVEVFYTPFYLQHGRGWPLKLRRQSLSLTGLWVFSFCFLDLGTSFRGLSEWMRGGVTWESYTDITLPSTGFLHIVAVVLLGTAMAYLVEPVITAMLRRIRQLPSLPTVTIA